MRAALVFGAALAAVTPSLASLIARDSVTANVYLGKDTGTPQHLASGLLYGVPDQENQVQDHWYTDMGFNYLRAGGAQIPAPGRGWIWGFTEYQNRFKSALSNYRTARKYNAKYVFLIHDLWGADGTQNSTAPYPGDNGDWTFWDKYFAQLVSDMKANSMIEDVIIDIWNEPDLGTVFWGRSEDQYLQYWGRAYNQFRTTFGNNVLLSGPAASGEPHPSNAWWTKYMSFISQNQTIPDQWAWHMETGGGNMIEATQGLDQLRATYNLPSKPININEYAVFNEQVPAGSAWWISQLERVNAIGLRGNWLSGLQLHDFLASLLSKPGAQDSSYSYTANNYYPNGDYQVYKYYNLNMTGHRVSTQPSDDGLLDCYATVDSKKVRVMVGVRLRTGTWTLQLNGLSAVGLPTSGTLNVHTLGFPASLNAHYGEIDGPVDLGVYGHGYSGDSVSFPIFQTDSTTAYVFEFDISSSNTTTTTSTTTATTTRSSSSSTTTTTTTTSTPVTTTSSGSTTSTTTTTTTTTTGGSSTATSTTQISTTGTTSTTFMSTSSTSSASSGSTSQTTANTSGTTTSSISVSTTLATSGTTSTTSTSLRSTTLTTSGSTSSTTAVNTSRTTSSTTSAQSSSSNTNIQSSLTTTNINSLWTTSTTDSGRSATEPGQGQVWTYWTSSDFSASITRTRPPGVSHSSIGKTITLTQTFVVPCATGFTTLTTTMMTTHCGCTETPIPNVPMTVTTITPQVGWRISTPYIATVPAQTPSSKTPAAMSVNSDNVYGWNQSGGTPPAATSKDLKSTSTVPSATASSNQNDVPGAPAIPSIGSNAWTTATPAVASTTVNRAAWSSYNGSNPTIATYHGGAVGSDRSLFFTLVFMGIACMLI